MESIFDIESIFKTFFRPERINRVCQANYPSLQRFRTTGIKSMSDSGLWSPRALEPDRITVSGFTASWTSSARRRASGSALFSFLIMASLPVFERFSSIPTFLDGLLQFASCSGIGRFRFYFLTSTRLSQFFIAWASIFTNISPRWKPGVLSSIRSFPAGEWSPPLSPRSFRWGDSFLDSWPPR